ncbi:MAG: hypothetical protein WBC99_02585, partial [Candidatus Omnitrophota bacterium]
AVISDPDVKATAGNCYAAADQAQIDVNSRIIGLTSGISELKSATYTSQEEMFNQAEAAYSAAMPLLQAIGESSDLASAQQARTAGLDAADELSKLGRAISVGAAYTTFVAPILTYRLDRDEELIRLAGIMAETLQEDGKDYYDSKMSTYYSLKEELDEKEQNYRDNYLNKVDDNIYKGLKKLHAVSTELASDALSISTAAAISGIGGEYALRKLYETTSQQAASMTACKDLIELQTDGAAKAMRGEDLSGDVTDMLLQVSGMKEMATQLQESALLAEYALHKAQAIAAGMPDNSYFQDIANGLQRKVTDLRNVADLMVQAQIVMENTTMIEDLEGTMAAYDTFVASALTGAIGGGEGAYAYLAAIEIADQAFKEARVTSKDAALRADDAARHASEIVTSVGAYTGLFDTILGPGGPSEVLSLLKERAGTAVLQSQSIASKKMTYAIDPGAAEQEENQTWDQVKEAEVDLSLRGTALKDFLDDDTHFTSRDDYAEAILDYENEYYKVYALTEDADGDGETDQEYTDAVNQTSGLMAAEATYFSELTKAKSELQSIESVVKGAVNSLTVTMQDADAALEAARLRRTDALGLESQLERAENSVLVYSARVEALEKIVEDLKEANSAVGRLSDRAFEASKSVRNAATQRLGEEAQYGIRMKIDDLPGAISYWSYMLPDMAKFDVTFQEKQNAEKVELISQELGAISYSANLKQQDLAKAIQNYEGEYANVESSLLYAQERAGALRAQATSARMAFENAENDAIAAEGKVLAKLGEVNAAVEKYAGAYGEYDGAYDAWLSAKRALEINQAVLQGNGGKDSLMKTAQDAQQDMEDAEQAYLILKAQADLSHDPDDIAAMNEAYDEWQDKIDEYETAVQAHDNYVATQLEQGGVEGLYAAKEDAYSGMMNSSQAYVTLAGNYNASFATNESLRRQYTSARDKAYSIRVEYNKRANANAMVEESAAILGDTLDDSSQATATMNDAANFVDSKIPLVMEAAGELRVLANIDKMDFAIQIDAPEAVRVAYTKAQVYEQIADKCDEDLYNAMMNTVDTYSFKVQKEKAVLDAKVALKIAQAEAGGEGTTNPAVEIAQNAKNDADTAFTAADAAYTEALDAYEDAMTKLDDAYAVLYGSPSGGNDYTMPETPERVDYRVYQDGPLADCLASYIGDLENGSLWGDTMVRELYDDCIRYGAPEFEFLQGEKLKRYEEWKIALDQKRIYETTKRRYSLMKSHALVEYNQAIDNVAGALNSVRHELENIYRQYGQALKDQVIATNRRDAAEAALGSVPGGDDYAAYRAELVSIKVSAQQAADAAGAEVIALEARKLSLGTVYGEIQDELFEVAGEYAFDTSFFDEIEYTEGLTATFKDLVGLIFASGDSQDMAAAAADIMKYGYEAETIASNLVNLAQAKALGATVSLTEITTMITDVQTNLTTACGTISGLVGQIGAGTSDSVEDLTTKQAARYAKEAKLYVDEVNDAFTGTGGIIQKLNELKGEITGISQDNPEETYAAIVRAGDLANRVRESVSFMENLYKLTQRSLNAAANALCAGVVADSSEAYLKKEAKAKAMMIPVRADEWTDQKDKYKELMEDYAEEMARSELGEHLVTLGGGEIGRAQELSEIEKQKIITLKQSGRMLESRVKGIDIRLTNIQGEIKDWSSAGGTYPTGPEGDIMQMKNEQKLELLNSKKTELETEKTNVQEQIAAVSTVMGGKGGSDPVPEGQVWSESWKDDLQKDGKWDYNFDASDKQYRIDEGNAGSYTGAWKDFIDAQIRSLNVYVDVFGYEEVREATVTVGGDNFEISWKDNYLTQLWLDGEKEDELPDPNLAVWVEAEGDDLYVWTRDWGQGDAEDDTKLGDEQGNQIGPAVELSCSGLKGTSSFLAGKIDELAERVMSAGGNMLYGRFESRLADTTDYEKVATEVSLKAVAIHDDLLKLRAKIDDAAIRNSDYSQSSLEASLRKNIASNLLAAQSEDEMKAALGLSTSAGDSGGANVFTQLIDEVKTLEDPSKSFGYNTGIMRLAEQIALRASDVGVDDDYRYIRSEMITREMANDAREKYLAAKDALRKYEDSLEKEKQLASNKARAYAALAERYEDQLDVIDKQIDAYDSILSQVDGRLSSAESQVSAIRSLVVQKENALNDLMSAAEVDYVEVIKARNEYEDIKLAYVEAERIAENILKEKEEVQREKDELDAERTMTSDNMSAAKNEAASSGQGPSEDDYAFKAELESKLSKETAEWDARRDEWHDAFSLASGSETYGPMLGDQVLGASAAQMRMSAIVSDSLKAFLEDYKVTEQEDGETVEYYLIEADIMALISEYISNMIDGAEDAQEILDVTGSTGTYAGDLQADIGTVQGNFSETPELNYPPSPMAIEQSPSQDELDTAAEKISEAASDLSIKEFGTQGTVMMSIADMGYSGGLGMSSMLVDIAEEADDSTSKYTDAQAIEEARKRYIELQALAQAAGNLSFSFIRTPLDQHSSLVNVQAALSSIQGDASAKYGEVTSALASITQDSDYYFTKVALEDAAQSEFDKASVPSELQDVLNALQEDLKLGEYGALSKTVVYNRGNLVREALYDSIRGEEKELLSIGYYTGTSDVQDMTVSEYDDDDILRDQTRYFRDYFILESETEYTDAGGMTQYRGRELPIKTTTYYSDGVTVEGETVNFYETDTRGLEQTQRVTYDRLPEDGPTVTMFTDITYTPEEPGRGRMDRMETYDLGEDTITLSDSSPVSPTGTLITEEDYYYSPPDVDAGMDAMEGLFAKDRLDKKTTTTHLATGGTESSDTFYSGLRGSERITHVEGSNISVGYEYSGLADNLRQTTTHDLKTNIKRTSVFSGYEGGEKVVIVNEYRESSIAEEELASVSRYFYSTDGTLLRRSVDFYEPYGSPMFTKRPVSRTTYEYGGESGHERIMKEISSDGVVHYYNYFMDTDPAKGLITAITTNPEKFDIDDLPSFEAQVVSADLMYGVYQDPDYKPTTENNVVFMDKDGLTIMSIDQFGTVQKFDYKRDGTGAVERDARGRITETYVYMPDGSEVTKGPDGFKKEEIGYDPKGQEITYTYDYETDNDGDVEVDAYGNPVEMTMEWDDWEYEYTDESTYNEISCHTKRTYRYGVLFSEEKTKEGYNYSKWEKGDDGVWRLKVGKEKEDIEDPDAFTLHISADGAIESSWAWEEGSGEKARIKLMPDEFGNYDFFAKKLDGEWVVHVYKGRSVEDKVYTGMTLKYEDENGTFGDLVEFNDRIADIVTLWKDDSGANKSLTTGSDYGQNLYAVFDRAPISQNELIYYEMREQMDFELEGGSMGTATRESMEHLMTKIQDKLAGLVNDVEAAKFTRDVTVDDAIRTLASVLCTIVTVPERGERVVTYDWAFNTVGELMPPPSYKSAADIASDRVIGSIAASMSAAASFGISGSGAYLDNSHYTGGTILPKFTTWDKSRTLTLEEDGVTLEGRGQEDVEIEQVNLAKFKEWVKIILDYASGSFSQDVAEYFEYINLNYSAAQGVYTTAPADLFTYSSEEEGEGEEGQKHSFLDWGTRGGDLDLVLHGAKLFASDEYGSDPWVQNAAYRADIALETAFGEIITACTDYEQIKETKFDQVIMTDLVDGGVFTEDKYLKDKEDYMEKARRLFKYMVDRKTAHALSLTQTRIGNEKQRLAQVVGAEKSQDGEGTPEEDETGKGSLPVWIPGSVPDPSSGGGGGGGDEDEEDEAYQALMEWMAKVGRGDRSPGMLDRYEYDLDKLLWQFKAQKEELARDIARKEQWLNENIFSSVTPGQMALSDDHAYTFDPGGDADTYLENYIKEEFWDEGAISLSTEGNEAIYAAEASNMELLSTDLIESFEEFLDEDHLYDNEKLEHLRELAVKADLYKRGSMMDPRYNHRTWDSGSWSGYIDETSVPEFYSDYGNQKANLASYAMFRYTEMAAGFMESMKGLHEQNDVANLARTLLYQIRAYNPRPGALADPSDEWTEFDASQYGSLAIWKDAVMDKLNTFADDPDKAKDFTYSMADILREAAVVKFRLVEEDAQAEMSEKQQVYNQEFSTFLANYWHPAQSAIDSMLQEEPVFVKTDVVELVGEDESYRGGKHFILRRYAAKVDGNEPTDSLADSDYYELTDTIGSEKHYPKVKDGVLVVSIYNEASQKWEDFTINTLSSETLTAEERIFDFGNESYQGSKATRGRLYDEEYIQETYLRADESRRNLLDLQEESLYRAFAAKVGMGGAVLADMYGAVDKYYAQQLKDNAQAYVDGQISEEKYIFNIFTIKQYRESHRDLCELYLLGGIDPIDLSSIDGYCDTDLTDDKLYGALKDAAPYMSAAEKREFIRGEVLSEYLYKLDSVFEVVLDMYDGQIFKQFKEGTGNIGEVRSQHEIAVGTLMGSVKSEVTQEATSYEGSVDGVVSAFIGKVTEVASKIGDGSSRISSFFDTESWVPDGSDYDEFRSSVTPHADQVNENAEEIGKAIVELIVGTPTGSGAESLSGQPYRDGIMAQLGGGIMFTWIDLMLKHVNPLAPLDGQTIQNTLDFKHVNYANIMMEIIMLLTNFTSTEGLNFESDPELDWKSWYMWFGPQQHLNNFAYSYDPKLRDAEVGRRVIESFTSGAFMPGTLEMEAEIMGALSDLVGIDVGSFHYIGEDRYSDYDGSMAKKMKEISNKKYLMKGTYTDPDVGQLDSIKTALGKEGSLTSTYNNEVKGYITNLNGQFGSLSGTISSMELTEGSDGGLRKREGYGVEGYHLFGSDPIDMSEFDVYSEVQDSVESFHDNVNTVNTQYIKDLMSLLYVTGSGNDLSGYSGFRGDVQPADRYATEGGMSALQEEIFNMMTAEKDGYEGAIKAIRDSYEWGTSGTTWDDATKGLAYGRFWVHQYAGQKFTEFYSADPSTFTSDSSYDALERTGTSYIKAINAQGTDGPFNAAWQSWQAYESDGGLASGEPTNAYMVTSLGRGVVQSLGDKEKTFGDGSLTYETDAIMDFAAGEFYFNMPGQDPRTDKQQRMGVISSHAPMEFDFDRIRPQKVSYVSDSGYKKVKILSDKLPMDKEGKLDKKYIQTGVLGGVFTFDEFRGVEIQRVFARGGVGIQSLRDFADLIVTPALRKAGLITITEAVTMKADIGGLEITLEKEFGKEKVSLATGISLRFGLMRAVGAAVEMYAAREYVGMDYREPEVGEAKKPVDLIGLLRQAAGAIWAGAVSVYEGVMAMLFGPAPAPKKPAEIVAAAAEVIRPALKAAIERGAPAEIEVAGKKLEIEIPKKPAEAKAADEKVPVGPQVVPAPEEKPAAAEAAAPGEKPAGAEAPAPAAEVPAPEPSAEAPEGEAPAPKPAEAAPKAEVPEEEGAEVPAAPEALPAGKELVVTVKEGGEVVGVIRMAPSEVDVEKAAELLAELVAVDVEVEGEAGFKQLISIAGEMREAGVEQIKLWVPTKLAEEDVEAKAIVLITRVAEGPPTAKAEAADAITIDIIKPVAAEVAEEGKAALGDKSSAESGQQVQADLVRPSAATSLDGADAAQEKRGVLQSVTEIAQKHADVAGVGGVQVMSFDLMIGSGESQDRQVMLKGLSVDLYSGVGKGADRMTPSVLAKAEIVPAAAAVGEAEAVIFKAADIEVAAAKLEQIAAVMRAPTPTEAAFMAKAMVLAHVAGVGLKGVAGGKVLESAIEGGKLTVKDMATGNIQRILPIGMVEVAAKKLGIVAGGTSGEALVSMIAGRLRLAPRGAVEITPAMIVPTVATPVQGQKALGATRVTAGEALSGLGSVREAEMTQGSTEVAPLKRSGEDASSVAEGKPSGADVTSDPDKTFGAAAEGAKTPTVADVIASVRQDMANEIRTAPRGTRARNEMVNGLIRAAAGKGQSLDTAYGPEVAGLIRSMLIKSGVSLERVFGAASGNAYLNGVDSRIYALTRSVAGGDTDVVSAKSALGALESELQGAVDAGFISAGAMDIALGGARSQIGTQFMKQMDRASAGLSQAVGSGAMSVGQGEDALDSMGSGLAALVSAGFVSEGAADMEISSARSSMGYNFMKRMDSMGGGIAQGVGTGELVGDNLTGAVKGQMSEMSQAVKGGFISGDAADIAVGSTVMQVAGGAASRLQTQIDEKGGAVNISQAGELLVSSK